MPRPLYRRVVITFDLEEQPATPYNDKNIMVWAQDMLKDHSDKEDVIVSIEFPNGYYGDLSDDDLNNGD